MLWNACPITAMHSVGSTAVSWWIALIAGLSVSSMSTPPWAASTRGPLRRVSLVGGGAESCDSQPSSARLAGSWSSRCERNVVPARNMPITTTGASIRSVWTSGCCLAQSTTLSRFTSAAVTAGGSATAPSSLSCASRSRLSTYSSRPSRKLTTLLGIRSSPKSSRPVCSTAAATISSTFTGSAPRRCGPRYAARRGPRGPPRPRRARSSGRRPVGSCRPRPARAGARGRAARPRAGSR